MTADRVVGMGHALAELRSVVGRIARAAGGPAGPGAPVPRGLLIEGPAGCGKTHLAGHVAEMLRSLGVPAALYAFGADEFGAAWQLRRLVEHLSAAPGHAILVIDQVDLIARHRASDPSREGRRMLSALLASLDGTASGPGLTLVGLTSEGAGSLDPAVRRPGRMNLTITVGLPDAAEREALWRLYLGDVPTEGALDHAGLAAATPRASPAAIAEWVAAAAGIAYADGRRAAVTQADVDAAVGRDGQVRAGRPRAPGTWRARVHEAGHVAVAVALRGPGSVASVRTGDGHHATRLGPESADGARGDALLLDHVCACLGGAEAEALLLGERSTGSAHDMARATDLALDRVGAAMDPALGPACLHLPEALVPEARKRALAARVDAVLAAAGARAAAIVARERGAIARLAERLGDTPDLEGDELLAAIAAAGLRGPDDPEAPP